MSLAVVGGTPSKYKDRIQVCDLRGAGNIDHESAAVLKFHAVNCAALHCYVTAGSAVSCCSYAQQTSA